MAKRKTSERVEKRRERVFELVVIDGYDEPAAIADLLLAEGSIGSKSRASALRLVQSDVALIRDRSEAARYLERRLFAMRQFRRIAQDDSDVAFDIVTPKGDTVTMSRPRWPAGVRARCMRYFSEEAEAVARVMAIDVTGKRKGKAAAAGRSGTRYVPIDLSELPDEDREAVKKAMSKFPGAEGGEDGKGAPN